MTNTIIWAKANNCMQCKMAKQVLDGEGIEYDTINVDEDEQALEEFKEKGYMSTPVIESGDKVIVGFKPDEIKGLK